jgi:hypothetical protein
MNCPICAKRTRVVNTRPIPGGVARKRVCARRHEFFTAERQTARWLHKDSRKTRKKLPPKPKPAPKKTWLDRVKNEAGKILRTMAP